MLLTITTTYTPATDLGFLLHKHPDRAQTFRLNYGLAYVFYPEASQERCAAALVLEVDAMKLAGRRDTTASFALEPYVNDRPYVASSFLSVAIAQVYGSALNGTCRDRPELAQTAIPLTAQIAVLPCRGGEGILHRLFEPLGYTVAAQRHPLDPHFPEWGDSPYYTVTLDHTIRLSELLAHLYVLLPVLDDDKHYWVGDDEVEKLLRFGEKWLAAHPERQFIADRFLKHKRHLTRAALAQLAEEDNPDPDVAQAEADEVETATEKAIGLHQQRLQAVLAQLKTSGAERVLDLGCGEGRLLRLLLAEKQFREIVGMDVSIRSLEMAAERLHLNTLPERQRGRIRLLHGSLMYRDKELEGFDAAALVEVIEHLDPPRLAALEKVLFGALRPRTIVITTPNSEYNVMWPSLPAGKFRHRDHRFEWTRAEFRAWAEQVAGEHGYRVTFAPLGPEDEAVGAPSQMGVFEL